MATELCFCVAVQVTKLFQGNSYLIRLTAENRVGTSSPTMTKQAITAKLPYGESQETVCNTNLTGYRAEDTRLGAKIGRSSIQLRGWFVLALISSVLHFNELGWNCCWGGCHTLFSG